MHLSPSFLYKKKIGGAGPQGIQGIPGEQGIQGDPGPQGDEGPEGPTGPAGYGGPQNFIQLTQLAAKPSPAPGAGIVNLYARTNDKLYYQLDDNSEVLIGDVATGVSQNVSFGTVTSTGFNGPIGTATPNTAVFTTGNYGGTADAELATIFASGAPALDTTFSRRTMLHLHMTGSATGSQFMARSHLTVPTGVALADYAHFAVQPTVKVGTGTVQNQTAFSAGSLAGSSNGSVSFQSGLAAATGNYCLFSDGTAKSYHKGNLCVGNNTLNNESQGEGLRIDVNTFAAAAILTNKTSGNETSRIWNQGTTGNNILCRWLTEGGSGTSRGLVDFDRTGVVTRYVTTSDKTLKLYRGPMEEQGEKLDKIQLHRYQMKESHAIREGPFAQDLYLTHPEAVHIGTGANDPWGIDKTYFIWPMLKELQSLRKRVAVLERR